MAQTYSLVLDWNTWDLKLDAAGNIQLFTPANYNSSVAQDAACAIKTFLGDCWYNQTLGMPWLQSIFGQNPPLSFVSAKLIAQVLTMANITKCVVLALGTKKVQNGNTTLQQLTGSVLVWPLGSNEPVPVIF